MDEILQKYTDYLIKERRYSLKTCRAYSDDVVSFLDFIFSIQILTLDEIDYSVIRAHSDG